MHHTRTHLVGVFLLAHLYQRGQTGRDSVACTHQQDLFLVVAGDLVLLKVTMKVSRIPLADQEDIGPAVGPQNFGVACPVKAVLPIYKHPRIDGSLMIDD